MNARITPRARYWHTDTCILAAIAMLVLNGCAGQSRFDQALRAAGTQAQSGDTDAAAAAYQQAADETSDPEEQAEARYRRAQLLNRAGQAELAHDLLVDLAHDLPDSARAARSLLDAGRIEESLGRDVEAIATYERVFLTYPSSAGALRAATAWVRLSPPPQSANWALLEGRSTHMALRELALAEKAKALEVEGKNAEAIEANERLAREFPLPAGVYTDEALLRSARLRRKTDPLGALATLSILADAHAEAAILGSHERPAYVEGDLLAGFILRDDLNRYAEGLEAFQTVAREHPHSRSVDDALWQAAWTAAALGRRADGCTIAQEIREKFPDGRLATCDHLLCSADEAPSSDTRAARRCNRALADIPEPVKARAAGLLPAAL